ncbi:MAG: ABC transporter ATP-binding protein [Lachnospiraceae bacterium]|nr:ABC transporter ATP-binding protein [Lachnospiraceae bacterium]
MIRANNLRKQFDGFYALDGVDLHVEKGSVYGLVGPNGAGKSTIIRHMVGVYRQDEGELLIGGEKVYENPAVKARIAYIPDDLYYFVQANVADMMKFYKGMYPAFDSERYEKLKEVFVEINTKKPIRRMSKGMQKQAAFWLALCTGADVLILDEPVDGLDPVMRRQVWSLMMQDVAERGTTVLVSSHNLRELEDVCDTVGILNRGKLMLERSLSSLQGSIVKMQVAFPEGTEPDLSGFSCLHESRLGSVRTLIIRGEMAEVKNRMATLGPVLLDAIPLTLEEIFIYELGGEDYAVKDILL